MHKSIKLLGIRQTNIVLQKQLCMSELGTCPFLCIYYLILVILNLAFLDRYRGEGGCGVVDNAAGPGGR